MFRREVPKKILLLLAQRNLYIYHRQGVQNSAKVESDSHLKMFDGPSPKPGFKMLTAFLYIKKAGGEAAKKQKKTNV
jgi:hypothetical protein